jgi:hypothetical protein
MMRKLKLYQQDRLVGTLEVPDVFEAGMAQAYLDAIPSKMIARSRSWMFEIWPGDFRLKIRADGNEREIVVTAAARLMPCDIGCLIGFEPAEGCADYVADEVVIALADDVIGEVCADRAAA